MNKLSTVVISLFLAAPAFSTPYFRPNRVFTDPAHPVLVSGALIDPISLNQTSGVALLPVFTHSPKDGCLLPSIVCESWSPLAVGASLNAGKITLDVAPIANVLPWLQNAAISITPAKWQGLINILTPASGQTVTFSAGPCWQYSQLQNKGFFKVFAGLELNF